VSGVLQVLIDATSTGSLYALGALGIGLLFGVVRLINFAHGDFVTIGAYSLIVPSASVVATLYLGSLHWMVMSFLVGLIVVIFALLLERVVFRPLRTADPATLLVGSFAVSFVIQNTILLVYGGRPKAIDIGGGLSETLVFAGLRISKLDLVTILVTIVMIGSLALFLKRTPAGIQLRAAAEDFRMARLIGVRANRVIAIAFALSGVLAAAVSLLYVSRTGILAPGMGVQLVLIAFVATVLGGMGSLVGAALGGFLVGVTSVLLQVFLPIEFRPHRDALVYLLVILTLLWRPEGLIQIKAMRERV